MKYIVLLLVVAGAHSLFAQVATVPVPAPVENKSMTLEQRFQNLKTKSESYQDFKVIKASTLDGEWKIFMDSLRASKANGLESRRSVAAQQAELKTAQATLQQKEASMVDVIYASDHIGFAGISFSKSAFVILFVVLIAGLALFAGLLATKLKLMSSAIREKADLAEVTQREFEEYKHKALEKQTKLSRELQNERNKLSEMRHG